MGHFSMEKSLNPGSALGGNQQVDRLSSSLVDFARLADLFDRYGVSFVSVTQNLDTSTSMGRLSLNVLLSFAQFEREIASERIREKIAASRRKGLWTGGTCPLGYRVLEKGLIVHDDEAQFVRRIFERYTVLSSVSVLKDEITSISPIPQKCRSLSRGALYTILKNPVYIGKLRLGEELVNAVHEPIVKTEIWESVQRILSENTRKGRRKKSSWSPALLLGRLFDGSGVAITRSKTFRHGREYAYYVSMSPRRDRSQPRIRVPCKILDDIVLHQIREELLGRRWISNVVEPLAARPDLVRQVLDIPLEDITDSQLAFGISRVTIDGSRVRIDLRMGHVLKELGLENAQLGNHALQIVAVLPRRRSARPLRTNLLKISTDQDWRDHGRRWFSLLATGRAKSQAEIATSEGVSQSTVSRAIESALHTAARS